MRGFIKLPEFSLAEPVYRIVFEATVAATGINVASCVFVAATGATEAASGVLLNQSDQDSSAKMAPFME